MSKFLLRAPPTLGVGLLLQPTLCWAGTLPFRLPALKEACYSYITQPPSPPALHHVKKGFIDH